VFFFFAIKEDLIIRKDKPSASKKKEKKFTLLQKDRISILFVILTLANLLLLNVVGYIVTFFLFSLSLMLILGVRSIKILMLVPVSLILVLYLVFQRWLLIPLPMGFFGF